MSVENQSHKRQRQRLTQRLNIVENEVHQAMVVLDAKTGKLLNYRQLMRHPTHKKDWQISSANAFGRLLNSVVSHLKGTNTIKFILMKDIRKGRMKYVTYGQVV